MAIPKSLKILGHQYEIIINDENQSANSNFGTYWAKHNRIWINSQICEQQQKSTLIHEILEAINFLEDIKLKHEQITRLEAGLYQVLKDNNLDFK